MFVLCIISVGGNMKYMAMRCCHFCVGVYIMNKVNKVIAITSGKGGTGKTTSAAAISSSLAILGHKTLCIDFDFRLKNLDLALCIKDTTISNIADVADGHIDIMDACIEHQDIKGLFYLSASGSFDQVDLGAEGLGRVFDDIREQFDYCILDTPAGIGSGFKLAHMFADSSIIVTTGEVTAIRDAQRTAYAIKDSGVTNIRLLVNRVKRRDFKWLRQTIDDMINTIGVQLIGVVQEDRAVFRALHSGIPLMLYARRSSVYEFMDATKRLIGENIPLRLH